jgi:predicted Zn-dependent protease
MKSKEEIEALLKSALSMVKAPHATVEYHYRHHLATRFGENAVTQNMGGANEYLRLVVAYGNNHGSAITNKLDTASVDRLVKRTEKIAKNSPRDPEYVPPIAPQLYPVTPRRYDETVVRLSPDAIAEKIITAVEMAKAVNYKASGLFEASWGTDAIANSKNLFAFDRVSNINYSTTMHGPLGSGSCTENGESVFQVDANALARRAFETAVNAQNPKPIEPGDYTVIFEPPAVADFLDFLTWNMSAREAEEGTTVFTGKIGKRFFNELVSIETRIDDPELPAKPFGQDGLPARRTVWVNAGIVERLRHDRYWAGRKNTETDPLLYPLFMNGQDRSLQDLIAQCKKGLLVKRLWYIRYVDRKELLLTGMTRDGLFLIENGRIVHPVTNLRFNESPVVFLQNVIAMSRPERVGDWVKVPGIMSDRFTFSSTTESV